MRIVRNKKIVLPVNDILVFQVENTHGTVSSRHGRDTPDIIYWGNASDFDNMKAPAKQRQQIHTSRLPE